MDQDQNKNTGTSSFTPTPGMAQVQNAVEFTETKVLQAEAKPMIGTSKAMADQAAAMMVQDMRAFLQGSEQVITMGTAKAIALLMDPATQPTGEKALKAIEQLMTVLPTYATDIGTAAGKILTEFDK